MREGQTAYPMVRAWDHLRRALRREPRGASFISRARGSFFSPSRYAFRLAAEAGGGVFSRIPFN